MAVSKVILNGSTLIDVTVDTVTAATLASGIQATKNDGTKVLGSLQDGDALTFGDNTLNWANVGQADYMVITDNHETSNIVDTGEVGLMILEEIEGTSYVGTGIVAE